MSITCQYKRSNIYQRFNYLTEEKNFENINKIIIKITKAGIHPHITEKSHSKFQLRAKKNYQSFAFTRFLSKVIIDDMDAHYLSIAMVYVQLYGAVNLKLLLNCNFLTHYLQMVKSHREASTVYVAITQAPHWDSRLLKKLKSYHLLQIGVNGNYCWIHAKLIQINALVPPFMLFFVCIMVLKRQQIERKKSI